MATFPTITTDAQQERQAEIEAVADQLQREAHAYIDGIIQYATAQSGSTPNYSECFNAWLFYKLGEQEVRLRELESEAQTARNRNATY